MRQWQTIRASALHRHVHSHAYAAVVLSGTYEEAGDSGRFFVQAGDVMLHEQFEAHQNRIPQAGAVVLNLRLPNGHRFQPGLGKLADPDFLVTLAEKCEAQAASVLLSSIKMQPQESTDWPDELARDLLHEPILRLSGWSHEKGIAAWETSRTFTRIFGITPSAFRARARARAAWKIVMRTDEPLASIAARLGFADQAHMTRGVKALTGHCPRVWRNACK
jgi:AraC-like DNA-binding protein